MTFRETEHLTAACSQISKWNCAAHGKAVIALQIMTHLLVSGHKSEFIIWMQADRVRATESAQ